jgi:hypothetical protein
MSVRLDFYGEHIQRSVEIEGDFAGEGSFKVTVNYINKIDPKTGEVAT